MRVRYEYTSIYNYRPDELYGMGRESLRIQSPREGVPIEQFLEAMRHNSSIKHTNNLEGIYGTDIVVEREDWNRYVGQPKFYMIDIKVEIIDEP